MHSLYEVLVMESGGVDRRPGVEVSPIKKPKETSRSAHSVRSAPPEKSLTTSASKMLAMFVALALLYCCDNYFFDGYYGGGAWSLLQQIGTAFHF
jgi:hypothetical protein